MYTTFVYLFLWIMVKLTIIIPTYNRDQALDMTLSQLYHQSFKDFEIILVDDHSIDNTKQIVKKWQDKNMSIIYKENEGKYQRDAKKTGLKYTKWEYICFFDDDIELRNTDYLLKIHQKLNNPKIVYQSKIIMEDLWEKEYKKPDYIWQFISRYLPIIDIFWGYKRNYWINDVSIFPLIECGSWFHHSLKSYFIDQSLILDGYWESIASSLRLLENDIDLKLSHDTIIYHIGNSAWGSKRFNKKNMLLWFTEFHEGYIYNMVYIHSKWRKGWVWLWIPYFFSKGLVALIFNKDLTGWKRYYLKGFKNGLKNFFMTEF